MSFVLTVVPVMSAPTTRGSTCAQTSQNCARESTDMIQNYRIRCGIICSHEVKEKNSSYRSKTVRNFSSKRVILLFILSLNQASGFLHMARHHHHKSAADSLENSTAAPPTHASDVLDKLGEVLKEQCLEKSVAFCLLRCCFRSKQWSAN